MSEEKVRRRLTSGCVPPSFCRVGLLMFPFTSSVVGSSVLVFHPAGMVRGSAGGTAPIAALCFPCRICVVFVLSFAAEHDLSHPITVRGNM